MHLYVKPKRYMKLSGLLELAGGRWQRCVAARPEFYLLALRQCGREFCVSGCPVWARVLPAPSPRESCVGASSAAPCGACGREFCFCGGGEGWACAVVATTACRLSPVTSSGATIWMRLAARLSLTFIEASDGQNALCMCERRTPQSRFAFTPNTRKFDYTL